MPRGDRPPASASAPEMQSPETSLVVNGSEHPLPRPASVRGALDALGLSGRPVAVELNGRLVRSTRHQDTALRPGDRIEIVTFVGGG